MSLAVFVLILINTSDLFSDFFSKEGQSQFYQRLKVETRGMEPLVFTENLSRVVLWSRKKHEIPAEVGRWRAQLRQRVNFDKLEPVDLNLNRCDAEFLDLYVINYPETYNATNVQNYNFFCLDETATV